MPWKRVLQPWIASSSKALRACRGGRWKGQVLGEEGNFCVRILLVLRAWLVVCPYLAATGQSRIWLKQQDTHTVRTQAACNGRSHWPAGKAKLCQNTGWSRQLLVRILLVLHAWKGGLPRAQAALIWPRLPPTRRRGPCRTPCGLQVDYWCWECQLCRTL